MGVTITIVCLGLLRLKSVFLSNFLLHNISSIRLSVIIMYLLLAHNMNYQVSVQSLCLITIGQIPTWKIHALVAVLSDIAS